MELIRPTQMCWVCGKAVNPDKVQTDEHGSIVHAQCHAARLALAKASLGLIETAAKVRLRSRPARTATSFSADQQRQAS